MCMYLCKHVLRGCFSQPSMQEPLYNFSHCFIGLVDFFIFKKSLKIKKMYTCHINTDVSVFLNWCFDDGVREHCLMRSRRCSFGLRSANCEALVNCGWGGIMLDRRGMYHLRIHKNVIGQKNLQIT